jgi:hypothetical protein
MLAGAQGEAAYSVMANVMERTSVTGGMQSVIPGDVVLLSENVCLHLLH